MDIIFYFSQTKPCEEKLDIYFNMRPQPQHINLCQNKNAHVSIKNTRERISWSLCVQSCTKRPVLRESPEAFCG